MKPSFFRNWGIFVGLVLGCIIGLVFNLLKANPRYSPLIEFITDNIFFPVGNLFLQSLFMIIVPMIFSSLIVGVADMSNPASIGRLSKRLLVFYSISTFIAIFIGQILMGVFQPGKNIPQEKAEKAAISMKAKMSSLEQKSSMVGESLWPGILTKIVPRNIIDQFAQGNMLAVIFTALLFGLALLYLPNAPPKASFIQIMSAVSSMCVLIIKWIMTTAPYAVAALIAIAFSEFGLGLLETMGKYMIVLTSAMALHFLGTYSLFLKFLIKIPVWSFFKRMGLVFSTAFSTSSSAATMPVTMRTLEDKFGIPRKIVSFSIPIGVQVNMDGTALFEVAAAVFIAQVFGVDLSIANIALLAVIVFITSVGIAGVPGGSIPILMSSMVILGIPAEGIALILGVDRLMDMGRTVVNVTGDSIAALYLGRKENVDLNSYMAENPS